uniref:Protein kinase domain-containing protein n=1 Tax=Steinernema glaseri TaxID=37863 RepID=A0A1I7XY79_9BILA
MRSLSLLLLLLLPLLPVGLQAESYEDLDPVQCPIDTNPDGCKHTVGGQFWSYAFEQKRYCNQRFIVDLSSEVTSKKNYNVVLDFIRTTLTACSDRGIGRAIFFNSFGLYNETQRCCSLDGCQDVMIYSMTYEKYVFPRGKAVYQNNSDDNNAYFITLFYDLKSMEHFKAGGTVASTVLITDRIYTRFGDYTEQLEPIFQFWYTKFTVVLVGRPEVTTADFKKFYNGVAHMEVLSVPDFDCLPRVGHCVEPCASGYCKDGSKPTDGCAFPEPPVTSPPPSTVLPTSPGPECEYELVYIFDVSSRYPKWLFEELKESMALPLKTCFNMTLGVGILSVRQRQPRWSYTGMDLQIAMDALDYRTTVHSATHPVDESELKTIEMVRSAVRQMEASAGGSRVRMAVLISDYGSEEFLQALGGNETLGEVAFHVVALNNDTESFYEDVTNVTLWDGSPNINVCTWLISGNDTKDNGGHKNETTNGGKDEHGTKAPASSVSTVLFISVGTCSALLLVLIGCTVLYRQKFITIKKIQKFRERHEAPARHEGDDVIDYWELSWDKLVVKMEKLGSGAYGQVYRGKLVGRAPAVERFYTNLPMNRSWENCDVAIKMLPKYATDQAHREFMNEIALMKTIGYNDNIVNMLGCITAGNPVGLVLEYCANRDMLHYLKGRKVDIQLSNSIEDRVNYTKDLLLFAWQIADGMNYIGSKNVVHRDLAARNILVDSELNAKIGDFGLCMNLSATTGSTSRKNGVFISASGRLPIKWLALECLQKHEFSSKSDVWSYGIVLYEMYTFGGVPFPGIEPDALLEFLQTGGRPERPHLCGEEMYEIMQKCWRENPEDRPSFQELLTIFTVLLERATENYGYLSLLKTGPASHKAISRLARSFCMSERSFRREGRTTTESTVASSNYKYPEDLRPAPSFSIASRPSSLYDLPPESPLDC